MKQKQRLKKFFEDQAEWAREHYENNDDAISGYMHVLLDVIDMAIASAMVPVGLPVKEEIAKEAARETGKLQRGYGSLPANALSFWSIDEIEMQISGLSGEVNGETTDDIYREITKGMTEKEINAVFNSSKAAKNCVLNGDCLLYSASHSSVQLVVDEEKFLDEYARIFGEKGEM